MFKQIHILYEINAARRHPCQQLSMLRYNRHCLRACTALEWVSRAAVKHRVCTIGGCNPLKEWQQIQQLSVRHIVEPRCHSNLQDTGDRTATEALGEVDFRQV